LNLAVHIPESDNRSNCATESHPVKQGGFLAASRHGGECRANHSFVQGDDDLSLRWCYRSGRVNATTPDNLASRRRDWWQVEKLGTRNQLMLAVGAFDERL
jgi:hypothetical protein